mmetsp:Transcript_19931/g.29397  ORF Transcript_19931/g.29397 Transcript_19931/m.29397 type:complete len:329 (-) Transcript_19931:383-1369(-)
MHWCMGRACKIGLGAFKRSQSYPASRQESYAYDSSGTEAGGVDTQNSAAPRLSHGPCAADGKKRQDRTCSTPRDEAGDSDLAAAPTDCGSCILHWTCWRLRSRMVSCTSTLGHLAHDASRGNGQARPADGTQLAGATALGQGDEDGDQLSGGGDGGADDRVEVGDGVEDGRLTHGSAEAQLHELLHDGGVGLAVVHARLQLTLDRREGECCHGHPEVGPEHHLVRTQLPVLSLALHLEPLLHAADEAVAAQSGQDEGDARGAVGAGLAGAFAQGDKAGSTDDGSGLGDLSGAEGLAAEDQGADHDRHHLGTLGQGGHGEGEAGSQGSA